MCNKGFGYALSLLKDGVRVARNGWNGKGMWIQLVEPSEYQVCIDGMNEIPIERLLPWIGMKTVDGCFVPWLASQTDILANDWEGIE